MYCGCSSVSKKELASYLVDVLLCFLYYDVTIIIIGGIFGGNSTNRGRYYVYRAG